MRSKGQLAALRPPKMNLAGGKSKDKKWSYWVRMPALGVKAQAGEHVGLQLVFFVKTTVSFL